MTAVPSFFYYYFPFFLCIIYQKQIETYKSIIIKSILPVVVSHAQKMYNSFFLELCFTTFELGVKVRF